MRNLIPAIAILLAGCSPSTNNAVNAEDQANAEISSTANVGATEGGNLAAPVASDNRLVPAPDPGGGVSLTAAPASTSAGSAITLTLANGSRQTVGYNLCTSDLQTAGGTPVKTDRICTMELRTLDPGGRADYRYTLPGSLPDGSYRFSTGIDRMPSGGHSTVSSNAIEVK